MKMIAELGNQFPKGRFQKVVRVSGKVVRIKNYRPLVIDRRAFLFWTKDGKRVKNLDIRKLHPESVQAVYYQISQLLHHPLGHSLFHMRDSKRAVSPSP